LDFGLAWGLADACGPDTERLHKIEKTMGNPADKPDKPDKVTWSEGNEGLEPTRQIDISFFT
jgi:hypothetical protein